MDCKQDLEKLLKELIDKGIIYEWYVNGDGYHWSYVKIESEVVTIKQNAGENRIEGGVVSVSGSVSKHRPFKNCDELKKHYLAILKKRVGLIPVDSGLDVPHIWVKHKRYGTDNLITAYDNDNESIGGSCVFIQDMWVDMQELFDNFTFLDGSPCGVLN